MLDLTQILRQYQNGLFSLYSGDDDGDIDVLAAAALEVENENKPAAPKGKKGKKKKKDDDWYVTNGVIVTICITATRQKQGLAS